MTPMAPPTDNNLQSMPQDLGQMPQGGTLDMGNPGDNSFTGTTPDMGALPSRPALV